MKKSEYIQELLKKDSLFPHSRFTALRHLFMKKKYKST